MYARHAHPCEVMRCFWIREANSMEFKKEGQEKRFKWKTIQAVVFHMESELKEVTRVFGYVFFNDRILQKIINGHSLDPSINTRLQKKIAVVSNGWQKQWVLKRTVAGGVSCLFGCCQHVVQQWRLMTSAQGKTQTSSDDTTCTCFRQMSLHVGGSWADSWKMIFASLAGAPPVIWFLGKQISLLANSCQCCKLKRLFGGTLTYTFKLVHDKTLSIHPFTYPHTPEPIPAVFGQ